jgi:biopolymer transport protein ExbD
MGAKLGGEDEDAIVDINITPFVDIILVVLIIFMVTATYINEKSIKVDLPDAATGDGTESTSLAITLDAESTLYLNGEQITESALRGAIQTAKSELDENGKPKDVVCLIGADHSISHGAVVHIIDLVKQEGIAKFAINIEPKTLEDVQ